MKKKIKEANQKSEIFNLSQDDAIKNTEKFYNDIFNVSLFGKQKVFLIDQCNDKILDTIKTNLADITVIIVSHRTNTVKICDKVYTINNGILKELTL